MKTMKKYHIIYSKDEKVLNDIQTEFGSEEAIIKHTSKLDGIDRVFYELRTKLSIADRNFLVELYDMKDVHRIKSDIPRNCEWMIAAE